MAKFKVRIEAIHQEQPATIEVEAEYEVTEMLAMLKAYPKAMSKVLKVMNQANRQKKEA